MKTIILTLAFILNISLGFALAYFTSSIICVFISALSSLYLANELIWLNAKKKRNEII